MDFDFNVAYKSLSCDQLSFAVVVHILLPTDDKLVFAFACNLNVTIIENTIF